METGLAFTENTIEVFCDVADKPANTNYHGGSHFCQFCGATNHKPLNYKRTL